MLTRRITGAIFICIVGGSLVSVQAQSVILHGTVVMADGSLPGKPVGTMRVCSIDQAPGPLTDKQGLFTWTIDASFASSQRCYIEATQPGFKSTRVEISNINPALGVNVDLAPIKLILKGGDPYLVGAEEKDIPGKGRADWNNAMKAAGANDFPHAIELLKSVAAANPKSGLVWHNIGILYDFSQKSSEASAAYSKAIETDPKLLLPYVALTRLMVREENWAGVRKTAEALIPLDKDRLFSEIHLHRAVADYNLKDLAAAETSATEALNPKAKQPATRAEYVLGRILEAKGDPAGAKQHMSRYLQLAPSAPDAEQIKAHIDRMGQPGAPEPELDILIH
jgi:tetratricopeptide (TPR) repeat protein